MSRSARVEGRHVRLDPASPSTEWRRCSYGKGGEFRGDDVADHPISMIGSSHGIKEMCSCRCHVLCSNGAHTAQWKCERSCKLVIKEHFRSVIGRNLRTTSPVTCVIRTIRTIKYKAKKTSIFKEFQIQMADTKSRRNVSPVPLTLSVVQLSVLVSLSISSL